MAYKIVLIVQNSVSLGSILMTEGVVALQIDTMPDKEEKSKNIVPLLSKPEKKYVKKFVHPLGKKAEDILIEYLQKNKTARWSDFEKYLAHNSFPVSSMQSAMRVSIKKNRIIKNENGLYQLVKMKEVG